MHSSSWRRVISPTSNPAPEQIEVMIADLGPFEAEFGREVIEQVLASCSWDFAMAVGELYQRQEQKNWIIKEKHVKQELRHK